MLGEENSIIAARVLRIEELNGVAVPSQLGERVETTDTDASERSIVAIRPPADIGDIGRRGGIRASHSRVTPLLLSNALGVHVHRSEEHTSELQALMRISYAVFCLYIKTNLT